MDTARLTALLQYCKLEEFAGDTAVESMLSVLHDAAVQYLGNAGITRPDAEGTADADLTNAGGDTQYDLTVNGMVLFWYEIRSTTDPDTKQDAARDFPIGVRQNINQLKPISF